jgi:tRNA(fMet)-specific endonuclease VapC
VKYLVDTDWTANWLIGHLPTVETLTELSQSGLAISLVTYGEIYDAINGGADPKDAENGFRLFLRFVNIFPLDEAIMRRFARIRGDLRRKGHTLPDPDLLIAATALHHRLILVTNNRRDFERIPRLRLYR